MANATREANEALEAATAQVNNSGYYKGREQAIQEVALHVRLASAHAQMAIARQAEIANLLQARKDFADSSSLLAEINMRLFDLMGI